MTTEGSAAVMARALPSDEVQVWATTLRLAESEIAPRLAILSLDERARADRFRFAQDRIAFLAGRSWLRSVLAAYLDQPPASLAFRYGRSGKPGIAGRATDIRFNLSHSGDRAVLAVTRGREIGIDIEQIRPVEEKVAERFFAPAEVQALARLPPADREAGFFRCWTRKEAYLKALGDGFSRPLDSFEVSLAPADPPAVLGVAGDPAEPGRWQVVDLAVPAGYAGALASPTRGWTAVQVSGQVDPGPASAIEDGGPAGDRAGGTGSMG